ncbi:tetratricopeptide repeat protein [Aquimarina sp. 2304DJ70-9]|uniref:tetratricopeptide repeat protein n=1 Tax=Aquimarina penaris TaxID=3231044 RepID=UPI00346234D8
MDFDNTIYEQIEAFIAGRMSEDEKKQFEEKILVDNDLRKEVDLHRSLKYAIHDKEWFLTESPKDNDEIDGIKQIRRRKEYVDLESKIQKIGDQYFENEVKSKKSRKWMYYVSASVAAILIAFFINYYTVNESASSLYAQYSNWKDLPSLTVQSDGENILAKGENLFFEEKYAQAIAIFSEELEEPSEQGQGFEPYILSYLGASYLGLNDYEKALLTFDELLNSGTVDSSKAYWYKAMVYLKQDDIQKAKNMLNLILKNERNFNFQQAKELREKLD